MCPRVASDNLLRRVTFEFCGLPKWRASDHVFCKLHLYSFYYYFNCRTVSYDMLKILFVFVIVCLAHGVNTVGLSGSEDRVADYIASPAFVVTGDVLTDADFFAVNIINIGYADSVFGHINMATTNPRIPIPVYDPEKSYELFKSELLLWEQVCNLDNKKKAGAVVLTLPSNDKCSIRTTILEKLKVEELTADDGLAKLVKELDAILGKDALEDALTKFEDFEDYSRKSENIKEYIRVFDSKYTKVENHGVALPQSLLAFKLLRNANISKEDKKLVMTGMDYTKKETLYIDAKSALKKYCGERTTGAGSSNTSDIKFEPEFKKEVFTNFRGYSRPGRGSFRGQTHVGYGGRVFWPHQNSSATRPRPSDNSNWRGASAPRGASFSRGARSGERPVNPLGVNGKPLLCTGCGSFRHFLNSCPESWENLKRHSVQYVDQNDEYDHEQYGDNNYSEFDNYYEDTEPSVHYAFLTGHNRSEMSTFVTEAQNCAVLDTACGSTVCGKQWFDSYINSVGSDGIKQVAGPSNCSFKFGAGPVVPSSGAFEIPVTMAGVDLMLHTDVVECDIPLLLSKQTMKDVGIVIDMLHDRAMIFGKDIPLDTTSAGHYCIPIVMDYPVNSVCETLVSNSSQDIEKSLLKLHRQFGHPPKVKLVKLLEDANCWQPEYNDSVNKVYDKCKSSGLCRFKDKIYKPVVSLPMASEFNEKIAMDLKLWKGKWIMHIVDMWSRFTISAFVPRKRPSDIIHALMSEWVGIFGVPKGILTDNGGEFVNKELLEVESLLNIEVLSTAAESPFQNGICERNHQVVDTILTKLSHDYPNTPVSVLLKWACMAKNTLQSYAGFSSYQLVIGRNPNLPNVLESTPSTLEVGSISEQFAKYLNGLHAARRAFIEIESNTRLKKALKAKVRCSELVLQPGERVYYKRDRCDTWLGPARVIFQDGKIVFIRHGGFWIKVSINRVVKAGSEFDSEDCSEATPAVKHADNIEKPVIASDSDDEITHAVVRDPHAGTHVERDQHANTHVERDQHANTHVERGSHADAHIEGNPQSVERNLSDITDDEHSPERMNGAQSAPTESSDDEHVPLALRRLFDHNKPGIKENDVQVATFLPNVNKPYDSYSPHSVYMSTVPAKLHKSAECMEAKQDELTKLALFDVYDELEDTGQSTIDTRWVITYKNDGIKARIVAKGFQESQPIISDSPTVAKSAFRLVLYLAASHNWTITTTDIKSAFLQGRELDRDVFLRPPKEANAAGKVWKLKRCLYGLNDGARQFYLSVVQHLKHLGCTMSSVDPSVFYFRYSGTLAGVIVTHVDDFLHAGNDIFEQEVMQKVRARFTPGKVDASHFKYIGFNVNQDHQGITIDMNQYVKTASEVEPISPAEPVRKLSGQEPSIYRSLVGKLNWIVQGTRPDKAFEVVELSTRFNNATTQDLATVKKVLVKLKEHESCIRYNVLGDSVSLLVYTDAAHANLPDGISSTGGLIVFIADSSGNMSPLSWRSNKCKRVVKSSLAAEALALELGIAEALYIRHMMREILHFSAEQLQIHAYIDSKSLLEALRSTKLVDDRRLRIDIGAMKQAIEREITSVNWISGKDMLANPLTKRGADGSDLLAVFQTGRSLKI